MTSVRGSAAGAFVAGMARRKHGSGPRVERARDGQNLYDATLGAGASLLLGRVSKAEIGPALGHQSTHRATLAPHKKRGPR